MCKQEKKKEFIDLNLSDLFNEKILKKRVVNQIKGVEKFKVKYRSKAHHNDSKDLSGLIIEGESDLSLISTSADSAYVYLLYQKNSLSPCYVGKAVDIKKRINDHLKKQYEGTSSKIQKVFDYLSSKEETTIEVLILRINPPKLYSAVEGYLITYFDCINNGWNERDD